MNNENTKSWQDKFDSCELLTVKTCIPGRDGQTLVSIGDVWLDPDDTYEIEEWIRHCRNVAFEMNGTPVMKDPCEGERIHHFASIDLQGFDLGSDDDNDRICLTGLGDFGWSSCNGQAKVTVSVAPHRSIDVALVEVLLRAEVEACKQKILAVFPEIQFGNIEYWTDES